MSSFPGGTIPGGSGSLWGGGSGAGGGIITNPVFVGTGLLYPALRKAAITLGPQRLPSPAQYQDALDELNRLAGSLSLDRLFIYSRNTYSFPLDGKKAYTIGASADPNFTVDFNAPRPVKIEAANIIMVPGDTRQPLFLATDQQWAGITQQDAPNSVPEVLYDDYGYPVSTLYLSGQPVAGYLLELFVWQPVPTFLTWDDQVLLPPGYEDALVLNLAVRLVTHFPNNANTPRQVDPSLYQQARDSLMRLMSLNAPQPLADTGGGGCGCGGFDIYSGTCR